MPDSFYEAGKDYQDLRNRIEALEGRRKRTKRKRMIDDISSPFDGLGLSSFSSASKRIEFKQDLEESEPQVQSIIITPPFPDESVDAIEWDSGSAGDTYINGNTFIDRSVGNLGAYLSRPPFDADDDERGARFLETWFRLSVYHEAAPAKLKVQISLRIEDANIYARLYDELGFSDIDFYSSQLARIFLFKEVGNDIVNLGRTDYPHHQFRAYVDDDELAKTIEYGLNKKDETIVLTCISDTLLGSSETAYVNIGIRTGLTFKANDYSVDSKNTFIARLDLIILSLV
jgi:hypothetical protein